MQNFNKKLSLVLAMVILASSALYLGSVGLASVGLLQSAQATETLQSQMNFAIPTASGGFVNLGAEIKGQIMADGTLQVATVTPNTISPQELAEMAAYMKQNGKTDLNDYFAIKSVDFGGKVLSKQMEVLQVQNPDKIKRVNLNKAIVKRQDLVLQSNLGNSVQKASKATIQKVVTPKQVMKVADLLVPKAYAQLTDGLDLGDFDLGDDYSEDYDWNPDIDLGNDFEDNWNSYSEPDFGDFSVGDGTDDSGWWDTFTDWVGDSWVGDTFKAVGDYFSDAWKAAQNFWDHPSWENAKDIFTGTSPEDEKAEEDSARAAYEEMRMSEFLTPAPGGEDWTFDPATGNYKNIWNGNTMDKATYMQTFYPDTVTSGDKEYTWDNASESYKDASGNPLLNIYGQSFDPQSQSWKDPTNTYSEETTYQGEKWRKNNSTGYWEHQGEYDYWTAYPTINNPSEAYSSSSNEAPPTNSTTTTADTTSTINTGAQANFGDNTNENASSTAWTYVNGRSYAPGDTYTSSYQYSVGRSSNTIKYTWNGSEWRDDAGTVYSGDSMQKILPTYSDYSF